MGAEGAGMSKRGIGGEVDWIVAIGLFLVFMGVVLTLFRPGIQPVFDHTALQTIVEENFLNDTGWTMYKQPIFLESMRFSTPVGGCSETRCLSKGVIALNGVRNIAGAPQPSGFPLFKSTFFDGKDASEIPPFVKIFFVTEGTKGFGITGAVVGVGKRCEASEDCESGFSCKRVDESKVCAPDEGKSIQTDEEAQQGQSDASSVLSGINHDEYANAVTNLADDKRESLGEVYIQYGVSSEKELLLNTKIGEEPKRYILVYANEQMNYDGAALSNQRPIMRACMITDFDKDTADKSVYQGSDCQARYSLGVRETAQGISLKKTALLGTDEACGEKSAYECVKAKWGFPGAKDFRIDMFTQLQEPLLTVNDFPVPTEAVVRVRQVNTFVLTEEGLKVPVTVSIKVW